MCTGSDRCLAVTVGAVAIAEAAVVAAVSYPCAHISQLCGRQKMVATAARWTRASAGVRLIFKRRLTWLHPKVDFEQTGTLKYFGACGSG